MAQRDVAGLAGRDRERDPDQPDLQRVQPRRLGVQPDHPGLSRAGDPAAQGIERRHRFIGAEGHVLRRGGGFRRGGDGADGPGRARGLPEAQPREQAAEAVLAQEFLERRGLGRAGGHLLDRGGHRRVGVELHQPLADPRLLGVLFQRLAPLRLLDLRRAGQQRFQVAIFGDELGGGLDADPGDAGDVVGGIPGQRLDLHHLVGRDAEFLQHFRLADRLLLDRVEHLHARPDQLHQVLVGGDDGDRPALGHEGAGIGRDHVVGLVARLFHLADAERFRCVADQGELRDEFGGRFRAVRLVGGVDVVAEGHPRAVEDHRDMAGGMLRQEGREQAGEAVDGVHMHPIRPGHRRQGVEGAEDVARPVDQDQAPFARRDRGDAVRAVRLAHAINGRRAEGALNGCLRRRRPRPAHRCASNRGR